MSLLGHIPTLFLLGFWLGILPLLLGNRLVKYETITVNGIFLSYIFGWVKMFALFQVLAIPFIFLRFSLTTLLIVWLSGILLFLAYYICKEAKGYINLIKKKIRIVRPRYLELLAVLLVLFQMFAITFLAHEDADDWFFIGQAVTDLHTNTLLTYVPDTGREWGLFHLRYGFAPFPIFLAVISRLVMIHPLIVGRMIFQIVFLALCYMVYYLLAKEVFGRERDKIALCLIFVSLLNMWGNISVFSSSSFLLFRLHQGKALLANFILPLLIYLLVSYYRENKYNQRELLLVMVSSTFVSSTGVALAPMLLGVYALARFARERKCVIIGQTILCSSPNIIIGLAFLMMRFMR